MTNTDISFPDTDPTTFADTYNHEFKHHYATRLERETGFPTEVDVTVEYHLDTDNITITTTADIVIYTTDGGPNGIVDLNVTQTSRPTPPTTYDVADAHAKMRALAADDDKPPAQFIAIATQTGQLERFPVEYDHSSWENMYKLILADHSTPSDSTNAPIGDD